MFKSIFMSVLYQKKVYFVYNLKSFLRKQKGKKMKALRLENFEILSVFSESERKAILNTIFMPIILLIITSNLLISLCWILMLVVIYTTVQKRKTENAKMFFTFLKFESLIILFITLVSLVFIVG